MRACGRREVVGPTKSLNWPSVCTALVYLGGGGVKYIKITNKQPELTRWMMW